MYRQQSSPVNYPSIHLHLRVRVSLRNICLRGSPTFSCTASCCSFDLHLPVTQCGLLAWSITARWLENIFSLDCIIQAVLGGQTQLADSVSSQKEVADNEVSFGTP